MTKKKNEAQKELFPSDFDTPKQSPGFLLWQVSTIWQRRQRKALASLDLTHPQFVLLASIMWLEHHDEEVTQIRLSQQTKVDPMVTSQVVRTLLKRKLIGRKQSKADSRAFALTITAAGKALATQALPVVEQVDADFFCGPNQSTETD